MIAVRLAGSAGAAGILRRVWFFTEGSNGTKTKEINREERGDREKRRQSEELRELLSKCRVSAEPTLTPSAFCLVLRQLEYNGRTAAFNALGPYEAIYYSINHDWRHHFRGEQ